jgi:hypothetical protein
LYQQPVRIKEGGAQILFASIYTFRASLSEATVTRLANLFVNWQPPKGYTIEVHYAFADGGGGMTLDETDPGAALHEAALTPIFRTGGRSSWRSNAG